MRHLTEFSSVEILTKHKAKVDLENKVVRDANFLGNRLQSVVDYLCRNHGWARTTFQPHEKPRKVAELML